VHDPVSYRKRELVQARQLEKSASHWKLEVLQTLVEFNGDLAASKSDNKFKASGFSSQAPTVNDIAKQTTYFESFQNLQ